MCYGGPRDSGIRCERKQKRWLVTFMILHISVLRRLTRSSFRFLRRVTRRGRPPTISNKRSTTSHSSASHSSTATNHSGATGATPVCQSPLCPARHRCLPLP